MYQLEAFRWTLAEAIVWCAPCETLLDPASSLRSVALPARPTLESQSLADRKISVAAVVVARAELLRRARMSPHAPATNLAGGRLLLFAPDETLSDGAAEVLSAGFFDADNAPPWDTWVDYIEDAPTAEQHATMASYLVCWVPPFLIEAADAGIWANPEDCIEWLADRDTPFAHTIQEAGLLV